MNQIALDQMDKKQTSAGHIYRDIIENTLTLIPDNGHKRSTIVWIQLGTRL
jgi:hypothetical protein